MRDDIGSDLVNFPFLDGDVQLIRFARVCSLYTKPKRSQSNRGLLCQLCTSRACNHAKRF